MPHFTGQLTAPAASCDWVTASGTEFVDRAAHAIGKAIDDHAAERESRHAHGERRLTLSRLPLYPARERSPALRGLGRRRPGAPIVFVPGMTDTAEDYRAVLPLFGRRTVVMELRGHGHSSAPPADYDFATLRDDVGAVVDAVTDGDVHLVTFSAAPPTGSAGH